MNTPTPQRGLFDPPEIPVNSTVTAQEAPRLSRQSVEILNRLRQGPATNKELAEIGYRYGARIHELRAAGYQVQLASRDYETGVTVYELKA